MHRCLLANQNLNSKLSAKWYEKILWEILRRSSYFIYFIILRIFSHLNSLHTTLTIHMSSDTQESYIFYAMAIHICRFYTRIRIYSTYTAVIVFLFHFGCKHECIMNPTVQFFNCFWLKMFLFMECQAIILDFKNVM